ncbi:unnamed protein product [Brachionus calyciflorus]|uniref:Uncharacterized protein n=1 Tax=Brachionus calyciflorus TaxID=104777 RepID=A0A813M8F5_9BILA|nr:unnamed protein product [Brachionus calyciflorus]
MGGSVSAGRNNDELIDNLVDGGLIKTQIVERVFRAVDRGTFYLSDHKDQAYRDLAWREGLIHISAPCIYTKVLENLELRPSQYFLNIGSGTGYFSTMVGLIIGENGVNHNIEIHEELVNYSKQKVADFIKTSTNFDDFDFCKPKFVHGNLFNLVTPTSILYDRIYVGAGAVTEHEDLIKNLLKINGICVMPLNDNLVKIKRIDQNTWEKNILMSVSYASLVTDNLDPCARVVMPELNPYSLQELCRFKIRQSMRKAIESSDKDYFKIKREKSTYNLKRERKTSETRIDESDSSSSTDSGHSEEEEEESQESRMERFERFLRPRLRSNNIDNELRLMIFGHLMDPDSTFSIHLDRQDENGNGNSPPLVLVRPSRENRENSNNDETENNHENESQRENVESGLSEGSQLSSQSSPMIEPSRISNENADVNNNDKNNHKKARTEFEDSTRKENLLRNRILKLSIPINVKNFLLYNRDI